MDEETRAALITRLGYCIDYAKGGNKEDLLKELKKLQLEVLDNLIIPF